MVCVARGGGLADTCGVCGKPIKAGQIFALRKIRLRNGVSGWVFCHLACDALRRGAVPERYNGTSGQRRTH